MVFVIHIAVEGKGIRVSILTTESNGKRQEQRRYYNNEYKRWLGRICKGSKRSLDRVYYFGYWM